MPMTAILDQVSVVDSVSDALLYRKGPYGSLLKLAEHMERIEEAGNLLDDLVHRFHLSGDDLCALQVAAFEWSDNIQRSTM